MLWEFPGGKIEEDESIFECLGRELREELSIHVLEIEAVETATAHYSDGGFYEVSYCHISRFRGEPVNNVFEQIAWVEPAELATFDILQGNRLIVERLGRE